MSDTLKQAIEDEGGLAARADLARFWGVSERRVSQMEADDPSFPAPIAAVSNGRMRLWSIEDAAVYRPEVSA